MYRISTGVPQRSILSPLLFIIYINDLCNASKLFKMIIYADDTTLYSTLDVFGKYISINLNIELPKVADWLKLNKLSINIKKIKIHGISYASKTNIPNIEIENIKIEFADEFNFLGLTIHKHLKWDSHINKMASKFSIIIGIMYLLKHMVPFEILSTIYNGLIKPHIPYGLKCWGFNQERIFKLQKKAMRIICSSGYLSHSEPFFKMLNVLKIDGMFKPQLLTCCFDLINNNLPAYFINMSSLLQPVIYHHNFRQKRNYSVALVKHVLLKNVCVFVFRIF